MICTNDPIRKAREVAIAMEQMGSAPGMRELYESGVFRHRDDVAYACIMVERGFPVADIVEDLNQTYREIGHRCDPVLPQ